MWKCNNCNYQQNKQFGLCPKCHDGIGEEVHEEAKVSASSFGVSMPGYVGPPVESLIRPVNPKEEDELVVKTTKYQGFNAILSSGKGFVEAQVCLLGADPGVGKSTLCMSIADEDTLYISSEENFKQVNARALRVNPGTKCSIMCSTSISEILEAIRKTHHKLVVVDSLNSIEFGVGYATVARFAHSITHALKETNKVGIIISQVTRAGEITGMNSIIHVVDTVLHLERNEVSGNIIAVSSKNRFGEIGSVAVFQHQSDGFVEIDVDNKNPEMEVGSTYTETRFGHKVITIAVESLVADSQAAYGIRKSNGYNPNRLMQLVGVLSYYGHLDLMRKDIYVAVSNGLYTDDIAVELAMANSILSSYYGKKLVLRASGEVRLNGKVMNGVVDGQKIDHINDLVKMYKEG